MYKFPFVDPQTEFEKQYLRTASGFIGAQMLVLIASMNFTYLAVALFLNMIGFLPAGGLYQDSLGLDNTTYMCIYGLIYLFSMALPLCVLLFRRFRLPKFTPKSFPIGMVYWGSIGAIGVCMGANIVTNYLVAFLENVGIPSPEFPTMLEPTTTSLILNLLVMAVFPAILEELIFRGCVLRALRPFGNGFAIVVSAVLFGLMHGNIRQIPFALMVGLALGYLYVITNSIWVPILVHFMNNALSVCMEYVGFSLSENRVGHFYAFVIYGLAVVGALAVIVFVFVYFRHLKPSPLMTRLTLGQRFGTLLKAPTTVIALVLFICLMLTGM